jgi:prepilin-type N-terminal cleavage/methylation domain-containing protein
MRSRENGFTLVEIAIVLVIIGLLLGGILKGQEMITQAKIKNKESLFFWDHLRRAGFVSGSGAENPFNAVSGKMGVQTGNGATPPVGVLSDGESTPTAFASLILCSANLPDKIAISVDAQMDDGLGKKGSVRGKKASGNPDDISDTADAFAEDGVSTYLICRQM